MFNKFLLFIFITLITISCYNLPDSSRKPISASLEEKPSFFHKIMDTYFTGKELIMEAKNLTKVFFDPYQQKAFIIKNHHSQWHMAAKDIHIAINGGKNNRKDEVYFSNMEGITGPCCTNSSKPRLPKEVLFRNKGKNIAEIAIIDDIEFNYITYKDVKKGQFKKGQNFKGDSVDEYSIKRPIRTYEEKEGPLSPRHIWDDLKSVERIFKQKEKRSWFKELFTPLYTIVPIYDRVFILKIDDSNLYNGAFFVKLKIEEYDHKEKIYKIKYDFLTP